MLHILTERLRQKNRTVDYPAARPALSERFCGLPHILAKACARSGSCAMCRDSCPTGALRLDARGPELDMGLCIFCGACARACPGRAIRFTGDWRLAATRREDLVVRPTATEAPVPPPVRPLAAEQARAFGRSFRMRQVSAAGCNACEADCNVLTTIVFDLGRFGVDFVASPRHADAMLVTGPVPRNMTVGLSKCWQAMPGPKLVIAAGACAVSGGLFRHMSGNGTGVGPQLEPDLFIPGCPPSPYTILDGLLRLLGRLEGQG